MHMRSADRWWVNICWVKVKGISFEDVKKRCFGLFANLSPFAAARFVENRCRFWHVPVF